MNEDASTHILLYGDNNLTDNTNNLLLDSVIEYITSTKLFSDPLNKKSNSTWRLINLKLRFSFDFLYFL